MDRKIRVVHIAHTFKGGAPFKLNSWLNSSAVDSKIIWLGRQDLIPFWSPNILIFDGGDPAKKLSVDRVLEDCDFIHVHNFIPKEQLPYFKSLFYNKKYIYHFHSPRFEKPVLYDLDQQSYEMNAVKRLLVGNFHKRMYKDVKLMPNVVPANLSPHRRKKNNNIIKILFSPSSQKIGARWSSKYDEEILAIINDIGKLPCVEIFSIENMTQDQLAILRSCSDITIDEILTGGFHQVSIEGLAQGNVVMNSADHLSLEYFKEGYGTEEEAPFDIVSKKNIVQKIQYYIENRDELYEKQVRNQEFFEQYLNPNKVIKMYIDLYKSLL